MKLLDANILLYAYDADSSHHGICHPWLSAAFNSDEVIALPWQTILAFVRIATNPRATTRPLQSFDACDIVNSWLERPNVTVINHGDQFWRLFQDQVVEARVSGPMIADAALAALAMENGATLCSTDRDFRRFDGLKLLDPSCGG